MSVVANYLLCVKWVFPGADGSGGKTKAGFVLTSGIGFFLNWGIMALLTALFGQDGILLTLFGIQLKVYHLNKAIATLLVMIWNYFTKRLILKKSDPRGVALDPHQRVFDPLDSLSRD